MLLSAMNFMKRVKILKLIKKKIRSKPSVSNALISWFVGETIEIIRKYLVRKKKKTSNELRLLF